MLFSLAFLVIFLENLLLLYLILDLGLLVLVVGLASYALLVCLHLAFDHIVHLELVPLRQHLIDHRDG